MAITFEIPELEADLRAGYGDLNAAAKEALLLDAYRTGRISAGRLGEALRMSASELSDLLDRHGVRPSYVWEDFTSDIAAPSNQSGNPA